MKVKKFRFERNAAQSTVKTNEKGLIVHDLKIDVDGSKIKSVSQSSVYFEETCVQNFFGRTCTRKLFPATNARENKSAITQTETENWFEIEFNVEEELTRIICQTNATVLKLYDNSGLKDTRQVRVNLNQIQMAQANFSMDDLLNNYATQQDINLPTYTITDVVTSPCLDTLNSNSEAYRYRYKLCQGSGCPDTFFSVKTPTFISSYPDLANHLGASADRIQIDERYIKFESQSWKEVCKWPDKTIVQKNGNQDTRIIVPNVGIYKNPSQWVCNNSAKIQSRTWNTCESLCITPTYQESGPCMDGYLSTWGDWKCDSKTNIATKTRNCIQPTGVGKPCPSDPLTETHACSDAIYSDWGNKQLKKVEGGYVINMSRSCTAGNYGGSQCVDTLQKTIPCELETWSEWSQCINNEKTRKNKCKEYGEIIERETCSNAVISEWGKWSTCKGFKKTRRKTCKPPVNGGTPCPANKNLIQTENCIDTNYMIIIAIVVIILILLIILRISARKNTKIQ